MTEIITDEPKTLADAEESARTALKAFQVAIDVLERSVDVLRDEVHTGDQGVLSSLKAMNGAYFHAITMKEKAREAGSKKFGDKGVGQLNLSEARAEIEFRLACLRAAEDGGSVSDELGG